jgi:restriction endonuclease S subunit
MAVFNKITYASLQGAKRLEAEYYQPKYMELLAQLRKKPISFLGRMAFVTDGIHASIDYDENSNIYCLSAQSVRDGFFDLSAHTMISNSQHQLNLRTSIREGDVIISSMGTIGLSAVAYQEMLPANAVRQVLIVRPKDKSEFFSYYLATFLNSKFGLFQSLREATGNVQQHLFIDKAVRFLIPQLLIQNKIGELHKSAERKLISSNETINLAEQLLLSELGLQEWKPPHTLTYVRNYSQATQVRRMDAEYFQPKYDDIVKAIKNYKGGWDTLGNVVNIKDKNHKPEDKQSYKYIELANIAGKGEITDCMIEEGQDLPSRARRKVAAGDVIVSSIEGSLSSIALIEKEYDQSLCSTGFHVVNSKSLNSATLLVLLKSIAGQLQLKKGCSGTILTAINRDELKKLILPLIDGKAQTQIQQKISESFILRKESKHLLECAKRAVEMAIEKDEKTAMKWINENSVK